MKIDWRNAQPRIKMVLAAVLVAALLITPSAVGTQVVQAQEAPAGRGQMAVVGAAGATFYSAPQGDELSTLPLGTVLNATSRTADSNWVEVTTTEGDTGWVKRSEVVAFGLDKLPVSGSTGDSATGSSAIAAAKVPLQPQRQQQQPRRPRPQRLRHPQRPRCRLPRQLPRRRRLLPCRRRQSRQPRSYRPHRRSSRLRFQLLRRRKRR